MVFFLLILWPVNGTLLNFPHYKLTSNFAYKNLEAEIEFTLFYSRQDSNNEPVIREKHKMESYGVLPLSWYWCSIKQPIWSKMQSRARERKNEKSAPPSSAPPTQSTTTPTTTHCICNAGLTMHIAHMYTCPFWNVPSTSSQKKRERNHLKVQQPLKCGCVSHIRIS